MSETLAELLRMEHEPVGVFYFDEKPQDAYELPSGKRNCVVSMMLMAAQGKPVVTYDENCACAGSGSAMPSSAAGILRATSCPPASQTCPMTIGAHCPLIW